MQGTYMNNDFSSGFSLTFKTFFQKNIFSRSLSPEILLLSRS